MYGITLFVHSWVRWLLLAWAVALLVRAVAARRAKRPWGDSDKRAFTVWLRLLDLQFTLGLLLYLVLSPIVQAAFSDFGAAMKSSVLRFYVVEHITAMVLAIGVAHIGWGRVRRAGDDAARHKRAAVTVAVWLVAVFIGIPWPFRPYGRPLARTSVDTAVPALQQQATPAVYARRCAVCHGERLDGAGVAAGSMHPPPRDFRDPAWQSSVRDDQLRAAIRAGGSARGLSTNMPAHPDLSDAQLDELIRTIRAAAKPAAP